MRLVDFQKTIVKIRERLRMIQRKDESTRKRYLIIASTLAMLLVIFSWFFYLNATLPRAAEVKTETQGVLEEPESKESFILVLGRGFVSIASRLKRQFETTKEGLVKTFSGLTNQFKKKNKFNF